MINQLRQQLGDGFCSLCSGTFSYYDHVVVFADNPPHTDPREYNVVHDHCEDAYRSVLMLSEDRGFSMVAKELAWEYA